MINKERALQQIDDIHKVMQGSFEAIIPGDRMIAIGICIMAIPLIEWFFSLYLDPVLIAAGIISPFIFLFRTIFYWALFMGVSKLFPAKREMHPLMKKFLSFGGMFPIIPVATAAVLAVSGYAELISPIILIIVGCFFAIFGKFSQPIVAAMAWSYIVGGLLGIYLTTLSIANLWMYLVAYQGLGCIFMGIWLYYAQKQANIRAE